VVKTIIIELPRGFELVPVDERAELRCDGLFVKSFRPDEVTADKLVAAAQRWETVKLCSSYVAQWPY